MLNKLMFASVDFTSDPNVAGNSYWYLSEIENLKEGDRVLAPLGRHNRLQEGIVKKVLFTDEQNAPYRIDSIKKIDSLA